MFMNYCADSLFIWWCQLTVKSVQFARGFREVNGTRSGTLSESIVL